MEKIDREWVQAKVKYKTWKLLKCDCCTTVMKFKTFKQAKAFVVKNHPEAVSYKLSKVEIQCQRKLP